MIWLLFWEEVDWPAAVALIGIAATVCGYWLQNRREARELEDLFKRLTKLEEADTIQATIVGRVDALEKEVGQLARHFANVPPSYKKADDT